MRRPFGATVPELAASADEAHPSAGPAARRGAALQLGTAIHAALEALDPGGAFSAQGADQRARIAAQVASAAEPALRDAAVADALACWDAFAHGPLAARLREGPDAVIA